MSEVKVLPVPEGSIIWLHNIEGGTREDDELSDDPTSLLAQDLMRELPSRIGHDRFIIVSTQDEDGDVEVFGNVEDLVERVRGALTETAAPDA